MVPVRAGTTFFAIMPEESYINGESQIPPPTPPPTYAPAAAAADGSSKTTFDIITPEDPAPSIAPLTTMEPTTETTSEAIPPTDEFQVADAVDPNVPIDTVPPDGFVAVAAANPTTAPSVAPGMDLANTTNMTPFGNSSNVTIYMNDAEDDESQSEDEAPGAEAAANAADGSGFSLDKAFQYANVFLVGGHCNIEDDWYTKFVTAGFNTLNATKIICSNEKDEAYTTEFHVNALKQVEEMAGDRLNETLVITAGVGLEADWSPVADLLRKGMAFFHAKEDVTSFNLTEWGLSPDDVMYFYFRWDEPASADRNGAEVCRLMGSAKQLKTATIYTGNRDVSLNYRVDEAVNAFKAACPNTVLVPVWERYHNISDEAFRTLLIFNQMPDIVWTCQDQVAKHFIDIAKRSLTTDQYSRLATTGWDNIEEGLLEDRKILTTVDQLVHYPNQGLWHVINTVVGIIETNGLNSTRAVQETLDLGDSLVIQSDTLSISADRVGYLLSDLLQGYDEDAPPFRIVEVSTGLFDVTITEVSPFDGRFIAVVWLKMSWQDPRLEWHPTVFNGTVPIDPEIIWTPKLFFRNEFDSEELYMSPATVYYNGTVVMEINRKVEFLCYTTNDLKSYPFDSYQCSMNLGAPNGMTLDSKYGFEVIYADANFNTQKSILVKHDGHHEDENPSTHRGQEIHFQLYFQRKPFTAYVRLILPAVLINFVGFMSFFIDEMQESVALGVTTLLCSLAYRETVDTPETSDVTWMEVFIMINVSYQAAVMFIIWCSYGSNHTLAKAMERIFGCLRPDRVSKRTREMSESLKKGSVHVSSMKTLSIPHGKAAVPTAMPGKSILNPVPLNSILQRGNSVMDRGKRQSVSVGGGILTSTSNSHNTFSTSVVSTRNMYSNPYSPSSRNIYGNTTAASTRDVFANGDGVRFSDQPSSGGGSGRGLGSGHDEDDFVDVELQNSKIKDLVGALGKQGSGGNLTMSFRTNSTSDLRQASSRNLRRATVKYNPTLPPTKDADSVDSDIHIAPDFYEASEFEDDDGVYRAVGGMGVGTGMGVAGDIEPEPYRSYSYGNDAAPDKYNSWKREEEPRKMNSALEEPPEHPNVDWIGRWIVMPSYIIVMTTLITTGWGFSTGDSSLSQSGEDL